MEEDHSLSHSDPNAALQFEPGGPGGFVHNQVESIDATLLHNQVESINATLPGGQVSSRLLQIESTLQALVTATQAATALQHPKARDDDWLGQALEPEGRTTLRTRDSVRMSLRQRKSSLLADEPSERFPASDRSPYQSVRSRARPLSFGLISKLPMHLLGARAAHASRMATTARSTGRGAEAWRCDRVSLNSQVKSTRPSRAVGIYSLATGC